MASADHLSAGQFGPLHGPQQRVAWQHTRGHDSDVTRHTDIPVGADLHETVADAAQGRRFSVMGEHVDTPWGSMQPEHDPILMRARVHGQTPSSHEIRNPRDAYSSGR